MIRLTPCLLLLAAFAAAAEPNIKLVDGPGNVGQASSIALGSAGPVVSYYDADNGDLKLATCTSLCDRTDATWVVTTVDSAGDVGRYSSIAIDTAGNPVIAYYDATIKGLKVATCTAACASTSPTWAVTTVDRSSADVGLYPSLQLVGNNWLVAYYDAANGDLRLATCTASCTTAAPIWTLSTVEGAGDVGRFPSMRTDFTGRLVIAYADSTNARIKTALCTSNCASGSPGWTFAVVDNLRGDIDTRISLALNEGTPNLGYYDAANGDLKVAICTASCTSTSPNWVISVVDRVGDAGQWNALVLNGHVPGVAYFGAIRNCNSNGGSTVCHEVDDLRFAVCSPACSSSAPRWVVSTMDNSGLAGLDPAMVRAGDSVYVSYFDARGRDLKVAYMHMDEIAAVPQNYTSLWWDPEESGWGINFSHQGDIVFATLFTYDAFGEPLWLVMSAGRKQAENVYSGELYRTTGPAFNAQPFTPIGPSNITQVGTMTVGFAGDSATLTYTVNGTTVNKTLRKQAFAAERAPRCQNVSSRNGGSFQDLWWNPNESGWGINFAQQGDTIFATLFTYDTSGRALWLVMSAGRRQSDGSFAGELFRASGPAFNAVPFQPIAPGQLAQVGTMRVQFSDASNGTLVYSVNGVTVTKAITRQVFSNPVPLCG
jgi:hypothetical protein